MTPPARKQSVAELTSRVEFRRAEYLRLKAAEKEVTRAELRRARDAYEHALVLLSGLLNEADFANGSSAVSARICPLR